MNSSTDTICALASGPGRAAIAVIRVSGPAAGEALRALCGTLPAARVATLRQICDPRSGDMIDRGLVLWFAGPASFTGEDMAELHVHGGRAVVARLTDALLSCAGVRLAEPGEFAQRAFENGKLDLTEVEGLADLINAETEAQSRQALAQAGGRLRALYEAWRGELLTAQSLMEAGLDFSDEGDVVADVAAKADAIAADLLGAILRHLEDRSGERLREGFRVVLAGPPNVGKSSLLNALAKRDVAIVSEDAGTTRDVIEVHLDLAGLPAIVTDTAGLREVESQVEAEGVRRALARAGEADLVLWLIDATAPVAAPPKALARGRGQVVCALNKTDLNPSLTIPGAVAISAKTGHGLPALIDLLSTRASDALARNAEAPVITRARHRTELDRAAAALQRFRDEPAAPELRAEELRVAAHHLGRLTGRIDVEEVLGAIFSEFCIGK